MGREWGIRPHISPVWWDATDQDKWSRNPKNDCEDRIGESHGKRTTTDQMPEVWKTPVRMWAYTDMQHLRLLDNKGDRKNGFHRCYLNTLFSVLP